MTVLGATGRTGIHAVGGAVQRGHEVVAFTRSPARLEAAAALVRGGNVRVEVGDVLDARAVERAIRGADAVVSFLGPTHNRPERVVSRGTEILVAAMREAGVRRLVVTAGAGVGDPCDRPTVVDRAVGLLLRTVARNVYDDMRRTVEVVRASDLDWTIVRFPRLTDGPVTGRLRAGCLGDGLGIRVSRADAAAFVLDRLGDDDWLHAAPVVGL